MKYKLISTLSLFMGVSQSKNTIRRLNCRRLKPNQVLEEDTSVLQTPLLANLKESEYFIP